MYAVFSYEQIEANERRLNEYHIVVLLFVRPSVPGAQSIIKEFSYLHHNTKRYCSVYAVGYTNDPERFKSPVSVDGVDSEKWYYSDEEFVEFKRRLEKRIKWKYSGENELLVLKSNPLGASVLNFQNYVAININEGLRKEYISSYSSFMEKLIEASRSYTDARGAVGKASRLSVRQLTELAIKESKRLPGPIREVLKNRLFFKTSRAR